MISIEAKDAFWRAVVECLVEFHNLDRREALEKGLKLRERLESSPPMGIPSEIFYHSEPFDVACDIADKKLALEKLREEYMPILRRYHW